MSVLRGLRDGERLFRYCNAGEEGKENAGGHPVEVKDQADEALRRAGWRFDGRLWYCPACATKKRKVAL